MRNVILKFVLLNPFIDNLFINIFDTHNLFQLLLLLFIIFHYCTHNTNKIITICRKTFPSLRATVLRDFLQILNNYHIYKDEFHNKSNSEYNLFGNLIEFTSLDQSQKIRGRKRDLLFINEGNELYWEDWQQLIFRTQERIILDFNP